ncbi:hypothetical protein IP93_00346 [Lysobacter ruishenii]|uniref:Secreted protein n=2 Tax=Aerolutibacter ruishenii TaxID=686800 RepID=A0A562M347_9GAMM|nr:hypothetical protein IP93_00346 [Lysobacter ruishenii]
MGRFTPVWMLGMLLLALLLPAAAAKGPQACTLRYTLSGWSALYSTANGTGTVTCDGGDSLTVKIRMRGGGLSFGRLRTIEGRGRFTGVYRIRDVLGSYVAVDAHAGAHRAGSAHAMTNGPVRLRMKGKGRGWDLGFAVSRVTLSQ